MVIFPSFLVVCDLPKRKVPGPPFSSAVGLRRGQLQCGAALGEPAEWHGAPEAEGGLHGVIENGDFMVILWSF